MVVGTGGIRKARVARGDSGKSGGLRVLYYLWLTNDTVYFLNVYAKNEKDNISAAEKKTLRELVDYLKQLE